jgi:anti-sigma regulatory factor (Ser/Thr protein kinase)
MSSQVAPSSPAHGHRHGFRHEALLYSGADEFLAGTVGFVRQGLEAGEPMLVVVDAAKIRGMRGELGADADEVHFADMADVGLNPARIIPAWREFVDRHSGPGKRLRGIGEPIWAGRSAAELVECQRHESLLNLAFADAEGFRLLCPYDADALEPEVIEEAHRSHPVLVEAAGDERESTGYRPVEIVAEPFAAPLPEPSEPAPELAFSSGTLDEVRHFVAEQARAAGLSEARAYDLILAVNEVATNSVRHGGGDGRLRTWVDGDHLIAEVRDDGHIDLPLIGRQRPMAGQVGGHGMWLVNQLCELLQVRSFPDGSVVRLHMRRC